MEVVTLNMCKKCERETWDCICYLHEEIEKLEALLNEARQVIAPFAHPDLLTTLGGNVEGDESIIFARNKAILKLKDTRRASSFLAKIGNGDME